MCCASSTVPRSRHFFSGFNLRSQLVAVTIPNKYLMKGRHNRAAEFACRVQMSESVERVASEVAGESVTHRERVPLCFVVEGQPSIRHFLSLMLQGSGVDTEEF